MAVTFLWFANYITGLKLIGISEVLHGSSTGSSFLPRHDQIFFFLEDGVWGCDYSKIHVGEEEW